MTRTILDSRGVRRGVPPPETLMGVAPMDPRRAALARARAAVHGVPAGRAVRAARAILAALLIGGLLFRWCAPLLTWKDVLGAAVISSLVAGLVGWAMYRVNDRTPPSESVAPALAHARLCLCCGYDLLGLAPAADGCTVCPEWGAAFALDSPLPATSGAPTDGAAVQRFTDRARALIAAANRLAKRDGGGEIDPEDILLAMVAESDGVGRHVLATLTDVQRVQARLIAGAAQHESAMAPFGKLPLSTRAQRLVQRASDESRAMGLDWVGTEHLLLAIIGEGHGPSAAVLRDLGVTLDAARSLMRQNLAALKGAVT